MTSTLESKTLFRTKIHPKPPFPTPTATALDITANATAGYSPPQAIWFYDAPKSKQPYVFSTKVLLESLEKTLAAYPMFAGRLEHIPYKSHGTWLERYGRLRIVYGTEKDPGVETVVSHTEVRLAHAIPSAEKRGRCWNASKTPFEEFSGQDIKIALHDGYETGELPSTIVKLTTFACGGIAIAVRLQHVLGDAQTFLNFVRDWATMHRSIVNGKAPPRLEPIFDPKMLEQVAAGDINAKEPDQEIMKAAKTLPIHRFDWWASKPDCPDFFIPKSDIPLELKGETISAPGNPIPWKDWNLNQPTPHYVLHFSGDEISRMHQALEPSSDEFEFSVLDALLAHLWTRIVQLRNIDNADEVYLNFAFNFRRRMLPPLPERLTGVPACMIHAKAGADSANKGAVRDLAIAIRRSIASTNADTIPKFLHEVAHQVGAQRTWQFFGGRHYITITSWLQHGMCEVDFGSRARPRFVEALMPGWITQLMESRYDDEVLKSDDEDDEIQGRDPTGHGEINEKKQKKQEKDRPWYSTGVDISFNLEASVVEKLLQEPLC